LQAWRADFDARLIERVRALGVTILQPVTARQPLVRGRRVSGVATNEAPLRSRFVVDAGGGRHWLARHLGLTIKRQPPRRVAWFGYATGMLPRRDDEPRIVADHYGWTWTARVRSGLYHWTRLGLEPSPPSLDWMPNEFAQLNSCGPRQGADVTWRSVSRTAGPGYFLAGDAAFVVDPASSHGVLKAIMSGILAGRLIVECLRRTCTETNAAEHHRSRMGGWFDADVAKLTDLYGELTVSA
jgi:flavin-dependent dehydrogenase